MIHVTLKFSYRGVPIEITVDAKVVEALCLHRLGMLIDKTKRAIDVMLDGKNHVSQYEKV